MGENVVPTPAGMNTVGDLAGFLKTLFEFIMNLINLLFNPGGEESTSEEAASDAQ